MISLYAFWALFTLIPGVFFSTWITSLDRMGFALEDATMTYAFFALGQAVLELPTGYLADAWGRKRTTITGLGFYAAGFGGVYFAESRVLVNILLIVVGFGHTMISGAYQAWFVDVLERFGRTHATNINQARFFLTLDLMRRINLGIGAWIGAFFLGHQPQLLWILLCVTSLIVATVGLLVQHDDVHRRPVGEQGPHLLNLQGIIGNLKHPILLGMLGMALFYGIETGNRDTIMQPYIVNYLGHGNPYGMVVIQTGVAVIGIIGNRLAAAWRRRRQVEMNGQDIAMLVSPLLVMGVAQIVAPIALSLTQFSLLYFTGMVAIGWFYPTQSFLLSSLIHKEHRAILLSAASMLECLTQAATCILVSKSVNAVSLNRFWFVGGTAALVAAASALMGFYVFQRARMHSTAIAQPSAPSNGAP